MYYNTGSKFRLSMPFLLYLSVSIIPSQHSIAHPLQGLGDFQGSYYCTQHAYTYRIPMSGHCASTNSYTCVTLWGIDIMTLVEHT